MTNASRHLQSQAEYEAFFDGGCLCPLPFRAGKDAICFGHVFP